MQSYEVYQVKERKYAKDIYSKKQYMLDVCWFSSKMSKKNRGDLQNEINLFQKTRLSSQYFIRISRIIVQNNCMYHLLLNKDIQEISQIIKYIDPSKIIQFISVILQALNLLKKINASHLNLTLESILYIKNEDSYKLINYTFNRFGNNFKNKSKLYKSPQLLEKGINLQRSKLQVCDLWSLGIILYEVMQGKYPFRFLELLLIEDKINDMSIIGNIFKYKQLQFQNKLHCKKLEVAVEKMLIINPQARIPLHDLYQLINLQNYGLDNSLKDVNQFIHLCFFQNILRHNSIVKISGCRDKIISLGLVLAKAYKFFCDKFDEKLKGYEEILQKGPEISNFNKHKQRSARNLQEVINFIQKNELFFDKEVLQQKKRQGRCSRQFVDRIVKKYHIFSKRCEQQVQILIEGVILGNNLLQQEIMSIDCLRKKKEQMQLIKIEVALKQ